MNNINTNKLQNKLILYIAIAMVFIFIANISILFYIQKQYQTSNEQKYKKDIQLSLQHTIKHHLKDFLNRLTYISDEIDIYKYIEKNDQDSIYKLLYPKFIFLQKQNIFIKELHIHLADGTSFLHIYKQKQYSNKSHEREILKHIHKNHKKIIAFELGKDSSNLYRLINPIFNKAGKYLGAIEIGIDPNFILKAIKDMNNFCGVFLINKEYGLDPNKDQVQIGEYVTYSTINKTAKQLLLKFDQKDLNNSSRHYIKGKEYISHIVDLKGFNDKENLKIIFFQSLNNSFSSFIYASSLKFIIMLIVFLILLLIIYKTIKRYQNKIAHIYKEQSKAVVENRYMLQKVFDTTPDIMTTANKNGILNANNALLEFFDYKSVKEFTKEHKCICEFFVEEPGCIYEYIDGVYWLDYVIKNLNHTYKVCMYKGSDKHYFNVNVKKFSYFKEDIYLIVCSDITELKLSSERYTFALNATNDGLWDWNLANDYVYFSDNWKKQVGYKPDELENNLSTWKKLVHPDDIQSAMFDLSENINGNTKFYENIHRLKHKDGHWVWILDRGETHFNSDGKAVRMIGTLTDISKIKILEQKLKTQKELFDLFMQNIPASIFIKDSNGKYIYVNSTAKKLYNDTNILGKEAKDYFDQETLPKILNINRQAYIKGKHDEIIKVNLSDKESYQRMVEFVINEDKDDKKLAIIAFDITKEYKTKKELEYKEEIMIAQSRHAAMGEMISMIAHQWRQPISVISMDANNILIDIEFDTLNDASLTEYANNILVQTQELSNIIDDFRDFFKPEKIPEEIYIKSIFDDAAAIIGKSLENHNIKYTLNIQEDIKIYTYSRELMQVIINIIKNAKEALLEETTNMSQINSFIEDIGDNVYIKICNNGKSIDADIIDKVFEPYFTTKNEKNGTGLGLYISKTIIEKHLNGYLYVKNTDNGVCFYIEIPKYIKK